jgi:ribosomal protein L10
MPATSKKQAVVQDIQNNFHNAKAVIFYNFHQAEDRDIFRLKKQLKEVGGQ